MRLCQEGDYFIHVILFMLLLSSKDASVVFIISSSHANASLPNRRFCPGTIFNI